MCGGVQGVIPDPVVCVRMFRPSPLLFSCGWVREFWVLNFYCCCRRGELVLVPAAGSQGSGSELNLWGEVLLLWRGVGSNLLEAFMNWGPVAAWICCGACDWLEFYPGGLAGDPPNPYVCWLYHTCSGFNTCGMLLLLMGFLQFGYCVFISFL